MASIADDGRVSSAADPKRRAGRPPATSRIQILAAARRLIDQEGWEKLTIRRLAAEIGIGATTLYHHVRDRDDLLIQLLNEHAAQVPRPELPAEPRERIVMATLAIHETLAQWPWAAEVLTVDGFVGRLDESALWMVEAIVAGAADQGLTELQAVDLFRHLWFYTVGEILVRARSRAGSTTPAPPAGVEGFFDHLPRAEMPHLTSIGEQWATIAARDTYRDGIEALVDGFLAQAAGAQS